MSKAAYFTITQHKGWGICVLILSQPERRSVGHAVYGARAI